MHTFKNYFYTHGLRNTQRSQKERTQEPPPQKKTQKLDSFRDTDLVCTQATKQSKTFQHHFQPITQTLGRPPTHINTLYLPEDLLLQRNLSS